MRTIACALAVSLALAATACRHTVHRAPEMLELRIAAASSLAPVFDELRVWYQRTHRTRLVVSYGATGLLARQIEQGAPFDVFAAADRDAPHRLELASLVVPRSTVVFARGRLVLWWRGDAAVHPRTLADVTVPAIQRIAIANPETAPFGRAAREALDHAGLWPAVQSHVVVADNVMQAYQFAATGNADVALTAESARHASDGEQLVINPSLFAPIEETASIVARSDRPALAREFIRALLSADVRARLDHHGFDPPP